MIESLFVVDPSGKEVFAKHFTKLGSSIPKKTMEKTRQSILKHFSLSKELLFEPLQIQVSMFVVSIQGSSGNILSAIIQQPKNKNMNGYSEFFKKVDEELIGCDLNKKTARHEFEKWLEVESAQFKPIDITSQIDEEIGQIETKMRTINQKAAEDLKVTLMVVTNLEETERNAGELSKNSRETARVLYWHNKKLMLFTTGLVVLFGLCVLFFMLNFVWDL